MSSNLPPGVQDKSIPGNRPEDETREKLINGFWDTLTEDELASATRFDTMCYNFVSDLVSKAIDWGYKAGFDRGTHYPDLTKKDLLAACKSLRKRMNWAVADSRRLRIQPGIQADIEQADNAIAQTEGKAK